MATDKRTQLTAALLLALGANLSLRIQSFEQAELAASGGEAVPAVAAAPASQAASKPSAAASAVSPGAVSARGSAPAPVVAVKPAPTGATVVRLVSKAASGATATPDAPVKKTSLPSSIEDVSVCDSTYILKFQEIQNHEGRTQVQVHYKIKGSESWSGSGKPFSGSLVENFGRKETLVAQASDAIKADRKAKNLACNDDRSASGRSEAVPERTRTEREDDPKEIARKKAELARKAKECRVDREGKKLDQQETVDCFIARIENLDDEIAGEADGKSKKGRELSTAEEKRLIMARLKSLVEGSLRPALKELALGRDGDPEGAISSVDEAISAVKVLARSARLESGSYGSQSEVQKLIAELEATKTGIQTAQKAEKFRDDATEARTRSLQAWRNFKANPLDFYAQLDFQNSRNYASNLSSQYDMDFQMNLLPQLQLARSQGILGMTDFSDYTLAFRQIGQQIRDAMNPAGIRDGLNGQALGVNSSGPIRFSLLGENFSVPNNLAATRASEASRWGIPGVRVPTQAPVLNLAALNGAALSGAGSTSLLPTSPTTATLSGRNP